MRARQALAQRLPVLRRYALHKSKEKAPPVSAPAGQAKARAKPGAKAVDAKAAVALPVHDTAGAVRAIVGLAWMDERELSADEIAAIDRDASSLPVS